MKYIVILTMTTLVLAGCNGMKPHLTLQQESIIEVKKQLSKPLAALGPASSDISLWLSQEVLDGMSEEWSAAHPLNRSITLQPSTVSGPLWPESSPSAENQITLEPKASKLSLELSAFHLSASVSRLNLYAKYQGNAALSVNGTLSGLPIQTRAKIDFQGTLQPWTTLPGKMGEKTRLNLEEDLSFDINLTNRNGMALQTALRIRVPEHSLPQWTLPPLIVNQGTFQFPWSDQEQTYHLQLVPEPPSADVSGIYLASKIDLKSANMDSNL